MPSLMLEVVTAEREVFSGEVDSVIAPGLGGELGILPRHAPLVAMLQAGELRFRRSDEETNLAIGGGFLEVANNRVIVLADSAERAEEIDLARAQEAQERARTLVAERGSADRAGFEQALAELRREQIRIRVARRARRQDDQRPGLSEWPKKPLGALPARPVGQVCPTHHLAWARSRALRARRQLVSYPLCQPS